MKNTSLALECALLFFLLPLVLWLFRQTLAFKVVPLLMGLGPLALIYLYRAKDFDRSVFFRIRGRLGQVRSMALLFCLLGPLMVLASRLIVPEHFLAFPREKPAIWALVMLLYPLLAALPQEIIFRCFFFHRYGRLFNGTRALILFNGISFGLFHLFYGNWAAPILSGLGGVLFAWRYSRSGSLPVTALEHALWGNLLFTAGLGWFFYSGSIR